ncbi:MAG: dCTP deaminase [Candidatus Latescibacteria bacterium]|nr:dCTP deaminase [Candidatus Latescibacterota bacterium]
MVKPDTWIRKMALKKGMITPFAEGISRAGKISYGLSSYGYDMRISNEFKLFSHADSIDPKTQNPDNFTEITCDVLEMTPHSTALARSVEYFKIPRDVVTVTFGKSTYARCGIVVNVTPFEPEWEGFVTISLINTNGHPVRVYANEGIAQVLFLSGDGLCETSYADKKGKYQEQKSITLAKIVGQE